MDLEAIARATDGFTGADLQALVYNANLEAVHETIDQKPENTPREGKARGVLDEEEKIRYVTFGPEGSERKVLSAAEETAIQRQVRTSDVSSSERYTIEEMFDPVAEGYIPVYLQTGRGGGEG